MVFTGTLEARKETQLPNECCRRQSKALLKSELFIICVAIISSQKAAELIKHYLALLNSR